jgi:hypothetical protein
MPPPDADVLKTLVLSMFNDPYNPTAAPKVYPETVVLEATALDPNSGLIPSDPIDNPNPFSFFMDASSRYATL